MNKVGNDVKCANGINISLELPIFKQVVTMFCDVNFFKYVASDDRKALILPYNFCMVYWLGSSFSESGINGRINCVQ